MVRHIKAGPEIEEVLNDARGPKKCRRNSLLNGRAAFGSRTRKSFGKAIHGVLAPY